jgi:hypothetical protein
VASNDQATWCRLLSETRKASHQSSPTLQGDNDTWKPYFQYSQAQPVLCNAYLFRDLQALWEIHEQGCATNLIDFLLDMKREAE